MATMKMKRTPEEIEDAILTKIFLATLTDSTESDRRVVYLEMTAAEMLSEGKNPRLCRDSMERVLIDRMSGDFSAAEPPFDYLVNCFRRACEEGKKIMAMKDENVRSQMEFAVKQARKLAASYCRIYLGNPGMFPCNNPNASSSPLLPLLLSEASIDGCAAVTSPPGFIEELFRDGDYYSMKPVLMKVYEDLRARVVNVSVLGEFQQPLRALLRLVNFPVGAKVLMDHLKGFQWKNGRDIEMNTVVGAFFHVSALPDHAFKSLPDVGKEFFSRSSSSAEVMSSSNSVRTLMNNLQNGLAEVLRCLLRNKETRENVLQYLAELINRNASRAHTQVDPLSCASSGMFVNLSAVMLRLCEPFLDPNLTKMDRIDPRYVLNSSRLEFRKLTALHASSEQVSEWTTSGNNNNQEFSFICECFFMTARVLNLGLVETFSHFSHLYQSIKADQDTLSSLKAVQDIDPSPRREQEIAILERKIESYKQEKLCYEAQILYDNVLLQRALSFYRLMVVWMVDLAGGFKIPAPSSCPIHFAAIPEHFVDDALELIIVASRVVLAPSDGIVLDSFMNFIVMFMASPEFIRNPYLRAKMVEALICWMPERSTSPATYKLFEGVQPALGHLVRNLLQLFVDIEFTGSHTQFYDKFNIRHNISKLLKYLWEVPIHRNAWRWVAKEEERGVYLQFLNFLINDSIYLLDESLNKVMKMDRSMAEERIIKADMVFAHEDINMFCYTSEVITAPFLLPEMVERIASMLNYFLSKLVKIQASLRNLVGPQKRVDLGEQIEELLKQIAKIYVNLSRGDRGNVLATVIKDGRSYDEELFKDAADELRRIGEDPRMIRELLELGRKAEIATQEAMEAESALGEIPEEFLDPILNTLMRDPVILPTSKASMDRPVILRHLLSYKSDPFSNTPLTADMLVPNTELRVKIDHFLRSTQARNWCK